jgi:hypothetical protein
MQNLIAHNIDRQTSMAHSVAQHIQQVGGSSCYGSSAAFVKDMRLAQHGWRLLLQGMLTFFLCSRHGSSRGSLPSQCLLLLSLALLPAFHVHACRKRQPLPWQH